MRFRASDAAAATGATLFGPDVELVGASFDSRALTPGQLFVALVAERDGHAFVPAAIAAGAGAALIQGQPGSGTSLVVADTAAALMRLGGWARERLAGPVIGVTGSVGKTSTKDLMRVALGAGLRVAANERSFNNEVGLPVTILNVADDAEVLVLEMGMRGFGEIARLCDVGRPTVGVVTRVAPAHTELVGGIEGVVKAKGELVESLPPGGVAVLNADDDRVIGIRDLTSSRVVTFGSSAGADVRIEGLELDDLARPSFTIATPWGSASVRLSVSGEHMASNAAAALAVAGVCGVGVDAAASALAQASLSPARMEIARSGTGTLVINDAYNANPSSMRAAIGALAVIPVAGRRVAILGMMAELADPARDHASIAELLHDHGIELIASGTDLYGVPAHPDPVAAGRSLTGDDAVLVKGSLVSGMQRVAALIIE